MKIEVMSANEAARSQEYYDLGGLGRSDGARPYHTAKRSIQHAIATLNRELKEIRKLERHTHQWNNDDRCDLCGADGRA
ncbi:MAG TPA: hypothetical protein VFV82_06190 [Candidatus Binatia bacterium]|nr:hypothetical protein [Candidatus Binatia bacterium]